MPSKIKLQTGVPIPATPRTPRAPKYPFAEMEVETNNTFFIPGAKPNTIHSAITRYVKEEGKGRKFTIRAVTEKVNETDEAEVAGIRVWRTE